MTDREKVVKGLEVCTTSPCYCKDCPYVKGCALDSQQVMEDALALLKEQEPLAVNDPGAICPNCKWPLYPEDHPHYCGNCGRAVMWDD